MVERPADYYKWPRAAQRNYDQHKTWQQIDGVTLAFLLHLDEELSNNKDQHVLTSTGGQLRFYSEHSNNNFWTVVAQWMTDELGEYLAVRDSGLEKMYQFFSAYDHWVTLGQVANMLTVRARHSEHRVLSVPGDLSDPCKLEEARFVASTKGLW